MPTVVHTQRADAPVNVLWEQIQDFSLWAGDIPGYVSHEEISPDESLWTVQGNVGALNRRVTFRVIVTERVEPRLVRFTLEGTNENVSGCGIFEALPACSSSDDVVRAPTHGSELQSGRRSGWLRRTLFRLVRRLFARTFEDDRPASGVMRQPGGTDRRLSVATNFTCTLDLQAGGLMGPVVNTLMEPLLAPAAAQLAGNIALAVEAIARGGLAPMRPEGNMRATGLSAAGDAVVE